MARLVIFLFFLFGYAAMASSEEASTDCKESLTDKPPFYLSGVSENKIESYQIDQNIVVSEQSPREAASENFIPTSHQALSRFKKLARGSLVQLLSITAPDAHIDLDPNPLLARVKVVSTTHRYSAFMLKTEELKHAEQGDEGYLPIRSLRALNDQSLLILKKDSVLATFGKWGSDRIQSGTFLSPVMKSEKYKITDCENPDGSINRSYVFRIYNPTTGFFTLDQVHVSPDACMKADAMSVESFKHLAAMISKVNSLYQSNIKLENLEINDWGLIRLPTRETSDPKNISEIAYDESFIHYQGLDPHGSDTWIQPDAACSLLKLAQDWKNACPQRPSKKCTLQVGDIAFLTPARTTNGIHDPLGHRFHGSGTCIDIRPFRNDEKFEPVNITDPNAPYNRELSTAFIKFLIEHKATPIYFNDSKIYLSPTLGEGRESCDLTDSRKDIGKKVKSCEGHDNHIHFCLEPERTGGCSL